VNGVKGRNFKLVLVEQKYSSDPAGKLSAPRPVNLVTDPQEREDVAIPYLHSWTAFHLNRILSEFRASSQQEPPVPAGAPLEFVPTAKDRRPPPAAQPTTHRKPMWLVEVSIASGWRAAGR
jgi:hypothetical protein